MRKLKLIRLFYNKLYRIRPPEFVQYWKTGDSARAKLVVLKDGAYAMLIEGEKYPLYGFPRGHVLFGPLARFKRTTKELVFNATWKLLDEKRPDKEIEDYVFGIALPALYEEIRKAKYDMLPVKRMCPAVREIHRAISEVEKEIPDPDIRKEITTLKDGITFFLQEDDAYRFRVQWVSTYLNPNHPLRKLYYLIRRKKYSFKDELKLVFNLLGHAEVTPDMKGRIKLMQRIILFFLERKDFEILIEKIMKELDWKKLELSKWDKYYFRGKYFKVEYSKFDY